MTESSGMGLGDILLAKFESSLNIQWQRRCGTTANQSAGSVARTSDGGYVFCGTDQFLFGGTNAIVVEVDGAGNAAWMKLYHTWGDNDESGLGIIQSTDSGFLLAATKKEAGNTDGLGTVSYCRLSTVDCRLFAHTHNARPRPFR